MQRDPAIRGGAIILFGIALMIFGPTARDGATLFEVAGLIVAVAGLIDAISNPNPPG